MAGPFYQEGLYEVEIKEIGFVEAKSGNPMIVFNVKVESSIGQDNTRHPCSHQYERTIRLTVLDEYKDYVLLKLRYIGWNGTKFESLPEDLEGQVVIADCKHERQEGGEYHGRINERWDFPLPPKESKPIENKPALAKKLNAMFGKSLKDAASTAQTQRTEPVSASSMDDGAIPF